jgi:hypothetical protein
MSILECCSFFKVFAAIGYCDIDEKGDCISWVASAPAAY